MSKSFGWKLLVSLDTYWIFQEYRLFAKFTIEMIENNTGLLLKYVDLSRKSINKNEI